MKASRKMNPAGLVFLSSVSPVQYAAGDMLLRGFCGIRIVLGRLDKSI